MMELHRTHVSDPKVGRFISEDPLRFDAGPNFYSYVHNRPVNWRDPAGLFGFGATGGAGGALGVLLLGFGVNVGGGVGIFSGPSDVSAGGFVSGGGFLGGLNGEGGSFGLSPFGENP